MRYLPRLLSFLAVLMCIAFSFTDQRPVSADGIFTLPTGFVDEAAYMGLFAPRTFAFTPDGRVLAVERGSSTTNDINFASIRVFKNGALLPTRAYTVRICGDGERGLLGIAVDPNFLSNHYIYIFYTRQGTGSVVCEYDTFTNGDDTGPRNRVSRLTMSGDVVVAGSERVLIDSILSDGGIHNAGDLRFGTDGYLYISTGNTGYTWTSQDKSVLNGKILRILPTAGDNVSNYSYSTTGNPYITAAGAHTCESILIIKVNGRPIGPCKEIFAIGFRNPYRFTMQPSLAGVPGTGLPIVGDVGDSGWEEVDQVHSGGNYGYPACEGTCGLSGYDNPIYAYSHMNSDSAIIGGDFYTGGANYPSQYLNSYFFVDYVRGFVGRISYNASSGQWVRAAQDFATGRSGIVGFKRGPDGNLYYLTFDSETDRIDGIHRIRYTGSTNQPPVAKASVNPQSGPSGTTYTFSAAGSSDPNNNTPLTYNWNFGDGVTSGPTQSLTVTHVYNASITTMQVATLTVTDSGNPPATSAPATVNVYPNNTPPSGTISLTNMTDGSRTTTYYAGDTFSFTATNLNDDKPLPQDAVTWEIVFHHQSHTHPFIPLIQGNSGQFTIPYTGELDPVVWYRVHLYITDLGGLRTEVIQDILPVTKVLTFNTIPSSGKVTIAGATFPTPLSITRVVGMHFSLTVPSPQNIWGISHIFKNWSQGGSQAQTITVPAVDTSYTATFNTVAGAAPARNYFTTHTPTLTWNRVTSATRYVLQVSTNPSFTGTGATTYQVGNNLTFTLPSFPVGYYYWHVAACTGPICGNYSATDTFVIDAP